MNTATTLRDLARLIKEWGSEMNESELLQAVANADFAALADEVERLEKALRLARRALEAHRVDNRSHAEWVTQDILPALDAALAAAEEKT